MEMKAARGRDGEQRRDNAVGTPALRNQEKDEDKSNINKQNQHKIAREGAGQPRKCVFVLYCENQGSQNFKKAKQLLA